MGSMILELVLQKLKAEGIRADAAYPGQKFPAITGPVAAVRIAKVNRVDRTVTAQVHIVSPAVLGGSTCEAEALRVLEILHKAGAVCVQNGCSYNPDGQFYTVEVLAEFTCAAGAQEDSTEPGCRVYVGGVLQAYAVGITAEKTAEHEAQYAAGSAEPVGISRGACRWELTLEERIPAGTAEPAEPTEPFETRIVNSGKTEIYSGCRWITVRREITGEGLRRLRKGIAQLREEE